MKKIFILLFTVLLALPLTQNIYAANDFRIEYLTREFENYDGIRKQVSTAKLTYNGVTTNQSIYYIGVNTKTTDYKVISAASYQPFKYTMQGLNVIIQDTQEKFPHLEIAGGVNGDFYDINNTGRPSNIHISNFEIYNKGTTSQVAAGFMDNGEVLLGTPTFLGQHINILNPYGEVKGRIKINRTNTLPTSDVETAVFYENYTEEIPAGLTKVVISASDIKVNGSNVRQYAKGAFKLRTTDAVRVGKDEIVLVGKSMENEAYLSNVDSVLIQELLGNGFENARFAMGMGELLVKDGVASSDMSSDRGKYRHPRTAFGITADGTVFFVGIDGRDIPNGKEGVIFPELALIMKSFGAVQAYNLDGGGSSTMMLKNAETDAYDIINTLSDGRIRSISNGLLFVKGDYEEVLLEVPFPDTRTKYEAPTSLYVDSEGVLHFKGNENMKYTVKLNNKEIYLTKETMHLLLSPGKYEIQVRAKGNSQYMTSDYSETYTYTIHPQNIKQILEIMKKLA